MAKTQQEIHQECVRRFLDLANAIKQEGVETGMVSASLMSASAIYATYAIAGNDGRLNDEGTARLAAAYKQQVDQVQVAKQARSEG